MNVYDGIHWNIYDILPFQRNFNFINATRSIGKSYTTLMYVIDRCIENDCEYVYVVRTQDEKKSGVLSSSHEKVIYQQFNNYNFKIDAENIKIEMKNEEKIETKQLGYCFAISESVKIKKRSFPKVKYIIFDEYLLEKYQTNSYVNGWHEPDLFLSIYHTIDREEDRVKCFLLGNTLNFFNPYHMHPAFNIPMLEKGKIWHSDNVLFQYAIPSEKLKNKRSESKFINMINGSNYGNQAKDGEYIDTNFSFIKKLSNKCYYKFTLAYLGEKFGVFQEKQTGCVIISEKFDKSCPSIYALSLDDHNENTVVAFKAPAIKWLSNHYQMGNVFFSNMITKTKIEKGVLSIL